MIQLNIPDSIWEKTGHNAERSRLPCSIWTKQSEYFTWLHSKANVFNSYTSIVIDLHDFLNSNIVWSNDLLKSFFFLYNAWIQSWINFCYIFLIDLWILLFVCIMKVFIQRDCYWKKYKGLNQLKKKCNEKIISNYISIFWYWKKSFKIIVRNCVR